MTPKQKVEFEIHKKVEAMRKHLNMSRRGLLRELITAAIRHHPAGDPEFLRP